MSGRRAVHIQRLHRSGLSDEEIAARLCISWHRVVEVVAAIDDDDPEAATDVNADPDPRPESGVRVNEIAGNVNLPPVTRCPPAYVAPVQGAEPIPEMRERNAPKKSRSLWGFGKAKRQRNGNAATKARKAALAQATQRGGA